MNFIAQSSRCSAGLYIEIYESEISGKLMMKFSPRPWPNSTASHRSSVNASIIGASKLTQLDEALTALEIKLTPDEVKSLEEPYCPHPVLGALGDPTPP